MRERIHRGDGEGKKKEGGEDERKKKRNREKTCKVERKKTIEG